MFRFLILFLVLFLVVRNRMGVVNLVLWRCLVMLNLFMLGSMMLRMIRLGFFLRMVEIVVVLLVIVFIWNLVKLRFVESRLWMLGLLLMIRMCGVVMFLLW